MQATAPAILHLRATAAPSEAFGVGAAVLADRTAGSVLTLPALGAVPLAGARVRATAPAILHLRATAVPVGGLRRRRRLAR